MPRVEVIENRAVGPVVAVTAIGQKFEGPAHTVQDSQPPAQLGNARKGQLIDIGARPVAVGPQRQEQANIRDGKAEVARAR